MPQDNLQNMIDSVLIRFAGMDLSDDISRELIRDALIRVFVSYLLQHVKLDKVV